ncbi:MAG: hypothetical protein ACXWQE_00240, partial [Bdellovibrionales bacterium]
AGDGGTGTYDGSDRWSDLGIANARAGTPYKANSLTNNRTGTLAVPVAADVRVDTAVDAGVGTLNVPARADVRFPRPVDNTTGTLVIPGRHQVRLDEPFDGTTGLLDLPAPADVKFGVAFDGASQTGTYEPVCDYPIIANVRNAIVYSDGNLTGTLGVPAAADVREGVSFDGGILGTLNLTQESVTMTVTEDETVTVNVEDV